MRDDETGRQVNDTAPAGVIGRPIRVVPGALLLGFLMDRLLPLPYQLPRTGPVRSISAIVAAFAILTGISFFAAGVKALSRAGTPVPTNQPARVLVTTGIYGWTRNPVYLGFLLMYVGIGMAVHGMWILILAVPLVVAIRNGVVVREEARLERRFGDDFRAYTSRVRRWL